MSLTPEKLAALDLAVETLERSGLSVESEDLLTFISRRRWTTSWRPVTSMSLGSRMAISLSAGQNHEKGVIQTWPITSPTFILIHKDPKNPVAGVGAFNAGDF